MSILIDIDVMYGGVCNSVCIPPGCGNGNLIQKIVVCQWIIYATLFFWQICVRNTDDLVSKWCLFVQTCQLYPSDQT